MRKTFFLLIAAALVLAAAWFFVRRTGAELSPESPAHPTADPSGPSVVGDEADASATVPLPGGITLERKRLIVQAAFACRRAERFRASAKAIAGPTAANPEESLSEVQRENMKKAEAECATDPASRTAPVEDFLLDLARGGNAAAAACYVSGMFRDHKYNELLPDDPRYRKAVPQLVERGIASGDWTMVSLAASINSPRNANSLYIHLPQPDPKLELLYTRLTMLGAGDAEKADLQSIVTELEKNISSADRKNAEAKAETLFRDHFSQSGSYPRGNISVCKDF